MSEKFVGRKTLIVPLEVKSEGSVFVYCILPNGRTWAVPRAIYDEYSLAPFEARTEDGSCKVRLDDVLADKLGRL